MINIGISTQALETSEFNQLIQAYLDKMPDGHKILVALENPIHQLAAIVSCLIENKRVMSSKPDSFHLKRDAALFNPDAMITREKKKSSDFKIKKIESSDGLLALATSGSSGTPKIVLHKINSLLESAKSYNQF